MNGYGLVAAIVQSIVSLAWPVAVVVVVWLFRRRLEDLLPNLRAKYKDFEISFRLNQAEKEAAALPPPPASVSAEINPTPEETDRFEQLASISPRAAITEIRREIEDALYNLAIKHNLVSRQMSMSSMIRVLRNTQIIDRQTSALLDDLRAVGNAAVHGGTETEFSKEDALRYRRLADEIIQRLAAP